MHTARCIVLLRAGGDSAGSATAGTSGAGACVICVCGGGVNDEQHTPHYPRIEDQPRGLGQCPKDTDEARRVQGTAVAQMPPVSKVWLGARTS